MVVGVGGGGVAGNGGVKLVVLAGFCYVRSSPPPSPAPAFV